MRTPFNRVAGLNCFANLLAALLLCLSAQGPAFAQQQVAVAGEAEAPHEISKPTLADAKPPIQAPRKVGCTRPDYPTEAIMKGLSGTVKIRFFIADDGSVPTAEVVKSTGAALLDELGLKAIKGCQFQPAPGSWQTVEYRWDND